MCTSFSGSGCEATPAGPGREGGTAVALAQFKQREPNGSDVQADGHWQPWDLTAASSLSPLPQESCCPHPFLHCTYTALSVHSKIPGHRKTHRHKARGTYAANNVIS